jgi:hypothetical protein
VVQSSAATVAEYLEELDPDRRAAIDEVRRVILDNLPDGYDEAMSFGMISYEIPLDRFPNTYNGKPLVYAALASQKNYMALYLNSVYGDSDTDAWFRQRYEATGKKLDMGKSCVRFRRLDSLPLELVGEVIAKTSVDDYIASYEKARG